MEDLQLLREYAGDRSEKAFSELVHRHVDFVYSTALRLVNETQLAEDVTQMVFIRLARKAGSLRDGTILTGWLYRTTQFIAQTMLRSDWRRRKRETLAMQVLVRVEPGSRVDVTLGGSGCMITGRLENGWDTNLVFYGSMWARERHGMRPPQNWRSLSTEERRLYARDWRDSPESEPFKR